MKKKYAENDTFTDRTGRTVRVGDFIEFIWWTNSPWGEIETYLKGRLVFEGGYVCFKYKLDGKMYRRLLSTLEFVPEEDWEKIEWESHIYPDNKIRPVIYQIR